MFRSIEGVYKINRGFGSVRGPSLPLGRVDIADLGMRSRSYLQKLKEIGPNPSSPKALGDLLMRWVRRPSRSFLLPSRR